MLALEAGLMSMVRAVMRHHVEGVKDGKGQGNVFYSGMDDCRLGVEKGRH